MGVQDSANFFGQADGIIGIGGRICVGVPGVKIERQLVRGTVIDKAFAVTAVVRSQCLCHRLPL